ncbi:hypothetical protein A4U53_022760 [Rhizobium ruizarguesonis]|uniref:Uncharacterized protein n=1 Tax=Rhizobium ruizarguesonis TaxID=2081791 RepID=A0ACD5EJ28_9HYPH|nr:hypothetical protein [Rhizobium leguminosarum]
MNTNIKSDCQQILNNGETDLSVIGMDDWSDIVSSAVVRPVATVVEDVLAEIDAIPVTAEFLMIRDTPQEVKTAAISAEAEAELDAVLADLDLGEAPTERRHQKLAKLYHDQHRADIDHHKRYGHIAQGLDAIDEWRTTEAGKEHRKLTRKEKRHLKALQEGRVIKPRRSTLSKEEKDKANAERQAKHRATVPASKRSIDRQTRRKNAKKKTLAEADAALQAIKDNAPF